MISALILYVKRAVECGVDSGVDGVMRLVGWAKRKVAERKSPVELAKVDKAAEVVWQKASVLSRRCVMALHYRGGFEQSIASQPTTQPHTCRGIDKGGITYTKFTIVTADKKPEDDGYKLESIRYVDDAATRKKEH